MITLEQAREVLGQELYTADGDKIGRVGQVYLDDGTGHPEWVTVQTGFFGGRESFVPLADAHVAEQGLTVPFGKDMIKNAPTVDVEAGHLSEREEADLYAYYGHRNPPAELAGGGAPTTGEATMTLSAEQLRAGTEQVETGRARLRKFVVTENVTQTVPVTRDEVVLERAPIAQADRAAMGAAQLGEEEQQVVLREERPVVDKEVVPVEEVRLGTQQVTEQQQVSAQVRREDVEIIDERR